MLCPIRMAIFAKLFLCSQYHDQQMIYDYCVLKVVLYFFLYSKAASSLKYVAN